MVDHKTSCNMAMQAVNKLFIQMRHDMVVILRGRDHSKISTQLCAVLNTWQIEIKRRIALMLRSCNELGECSVCWADGLKSISTVLAEKDDIDPLFTTKSQG